MAVFGVVSVVWGYCVGVVGYWRWCVDVVGRGGVLVMSCLGVGVEGGGWARDPPTEAFKDMPTRRRESTP